MARGNATGQRGLTRREDGRWIIDFRYKDAKTGARLRHVEKLPATMAFAAARERARLVVNGLLDGTFKVEKPTEAKHLFKALEAYCEWAKTNRPATHRTRCTRSNVLRRGFGDLALENISPFHVERFKRNRLAEGVTPATVNRAVAMLKHFLGLVSSWGWVREATARAVAGVKLLKEAPGRVRYLSADEETALMANLEGVVKHIVLTALLSGMRREEVIRLRRDAVDLPHRQITLMKTKNNKVRRIPINDALALVLEDAIKASAGGEFVFTNRHGRPYTGNGFRVGWEKAANKAKLVDFHFHDLRHDFATKLRRRGVGIDVIAQLLGHSSLAMAQRYTHIGQDLLREAVDKLCTPPAAAPSAAPAIASPLPPPTPLAAVK